MSAKKKLVTKIIITIRNRYNTYNIIINRTRNIMCNVILTLYDEEIQSLMVYYIILYII